MNSSVSVSFEKIVIGQKYTRAQLCPLWGYKSEEAIKRGVLTPANSRFIILFITIEKDKKTESSGFTPEVPYEDSLEGDILLIDGQEKHGTDERIINAATDKDEIHLFLRDRGRQPFTYYGEISLIDYELFSDRPSRFRFKVSDIIEPEPLTQSLIEIVEHIQKLEDKYRDSVPRVKEKVSKRIERGKISKKVKEFNEYKCQVCEKLSEYPYSFKKMNGDHYIETHHIIPVSNLEKGTLGILNLITVCANHHRQLHYGDVELINNEDDFLEYRIEDRRIVINKTKLDL